MACAKMFELIHGSLTGGEEEAEVSFQHPNQYFEESYKRLHKNLGKLFYLHKNLGKLFYLHRNLGKQFLYSGTQQHYNSVHLFLLSLVWPDVVP